MTAASTIDATRASAPKETSSTMSRWLSLSKAEGLQFLRNRTLLFMALIFPVGMALGMFFLMKNVGDEVSAAATSIEIFFLMSLLFVQFYAVLSMTTTRRDEKVLKRLRTGELRDGEILAAISTPAAITMVVLTLIFFGALTALGVAFAVNVIPVLVALVLGIGVSIGFGFLTSRFTQNAEAAQMTSMPVMGLAFMTMSSWRVLMPEDLENAVNWSPFALIGDLAQLGWTGATGMRMNGGEPVLDASAVLHESLPLMGALAVWAVVLLWAGMRYMKWETNR